MSGINMSHLGVSATLLNLKILLNPMKMQNLYNKDQERIKKSMRTEIFCLLLAFALTLLTILIFYLAIVKEREKVKPYQPNRTIVLSDTTNTWEDNFDSTYIFNGCIHYTHKSI